MRILCANVGSTSFKYQIIDMETTASLVKGGVERIGNSPSAFTHAVPGKPAVEGEIDAPTHTGAIAHAIRLITDPEVGCLANLEQLDGVGFKTILAKGYWRSARITEDVIAALEASTPLAPMHNPAYIASIRAFQELLSTTPLVAVFETWFHQTIPDYAAEFGVPRFWVEKHDIRRYGYHGASHRYISERVPQLLRRESGDGLRIISCHLGGSSSLCAIKDGKSIDTSMGTSTQYGMIQSTRCGELDAFAVLYLMDKEGFSTDEIRRQLIEDSGVKGISGTSGDMRDVEEAIESGNDKARLALDTYCYGVKKYIGAYIAALGGVDVIAFAGGIGEKDPIARAKICEGLEWCGIRLDPVKNEQCTGESDLSADNSRAKILVVSTDEEFIVSRETARLLS
ncbi:acetate/propionate family kinase [Candidatus Poribacteria bacterium]|nr:acetate/propionate family kinase [Candidatus Poribacteria bacterium]MYK19184.1 acetate/propionate family kinase [Candidatus Poribacteria bacterium]